MSQVIIGLLITIAGFMMSWKNERLLKFFGPIRWAEKHFPYAGGTRFFYKILGIIIIILGLFIITGIWEDLLNGLASIF